jgi:hypothetical protein
MASIISSLIRFVHPQPNSTIVRLYAVADLIGVAGRAESATSRHCPVRKRKSQVQALNRTQPILPLVRGVPARQSHDYEWHGVTSWFAATDVTNGVETSSCYRRRRHQESLRFSTTSTLISPAALTST